jgi:branched-chain amino acid aminotransferase
LDSKGEGKSLYIRPLVFATEETLKARISEKYMFAIVTSPAQMYYAEPVAVKFQTIILVLQKVE